MAKKKNSRKALAVALGIMGIAGLSVASASQLTMTTSEEVGVGVEAFGDNCQAGTTLAVAYDYAANASAATSGFGITDVTVSNIAAACAGLDITVSLEDSTGTELFTSTATAISGTTYTYTATTDNIDLAEDLGDVIVVIG